MSFEKSYGDHDGFKGGYPPLKSAAHVMFGGLDPGHLRCPRLNLVFLGQIKSDWADFGFITLPTKLDTK